MKPLLNFLLFLAIGIVLYVIAAFSKRKFPSASRLYLVLNTIVVIIALSVGHLKAHSSGIPAFVTTAVTVLADGVRLLLGYCLSAIVHSFFFTYPNPGITSRNRQLHYVVRALFIQVGLTFLSAAIGKVTATGFAFMTAFFRVSGYSLSFLYFIIAVELVFGWLMLLRVQVYVKLAALLMLFAVMAGAVVTHARNHDPLAGSGSAILLGTQILLATALYLLLRKQTAQSKEMPTQPVPAG